MRVIICLVILIAGCSKSKTNDMKDVRKHFEDIYDNFNKRNIDLVIDNMTPDVMWANGMDGGFVYGHEGVREYWTRQFKLVSSNVTPLEVKEENDEVTVKVHQVVHDLDGKLLADEIVTHIFKLREGKITRFDIKK
jgi:ketosteroid isomerase-like protein